MKQKFSDILNIFKQNEQDYVECVILLSEDDLLRNAFLAWRSIVTEYDSDLICDFNEEKYQWEWLWENTKFDYNKFAVLANVKKYEVIDLVDRLRAFHLIYPDGTCHTYGRAYLRETIKRKLPIQKEQKSDKK